MKKPGLVKGSKYNNRPDDGVHPEYNSIGEKRCRRCNKFLHHSEFTYKKAVCKKCRAEIMSDEYWEGTSGCSDKRKYHIKYQREIGNKKK